MRKLLLLIPLVLLACAGFSQKLVDRNEDGRFIKMRTTTDSDYHYIDTLVSTANEAGVLEVTAIGYKSDGTLAVTGVLKYRYVIADGTLTLGTAVNDQTIVVDSGLSPATFDVAASSNKMYVRVKGKLSVTLYWVTMVKRKCLVLNL